MSTPVGSDGIDVATGAVVGLVAFFLLVAVVAVAGVGFALLHLAVVLAMLAIQLRALTAAMDDTGGNR